MSISPCCSVKCSWSVLVSPDLFCFVLFFWWDGSRGFKIPLNDQVPPSNNTYIIKHGFGFWKSRRHCEAYNQIQLTHHYSANSKKMGKVVELVLRGWSVGVISCSARNIFVRRISLKKKKKKRKVLRILQNALEQCSLKTDACLVPAWMLKSILDLVCLLYIHSIYAKTWIKNLLWFHKKLVW